MAAEKGSKPKWEPAKPLRRPDFIQSSEFGHRKHFYPTYEQDPVDMFYLIGMEYQRIWARERTAWEEQYYPIPTERKVLKIRAVKGTKTATKKTQSPPFKMKKFQNVPARTDHRRPPKTSQTEQKGEAMKPCTCDPDKHKQGDLNAVSKVHTPKLTAREKDDLNTDAEKEKKLESASHHSDIQKPHEKSSDCKSHKSQDRKSECSHKSDDRKSECSHKSHDYKSECSHKSHDSKSECSHTDVKIAEADADIKREDAEHSTCCCDKQNQEPVSN